MIDAIFLQNAIKNALKKEFEELRERLDRIESMVKDDKKPVKQTKDK